MLSLFLALLAPLPLDVAPPRQIVVQVKKAPDFNPPDVLIPVSGFATFIPPADVKDVKYIGLDGEEPFPVALIGGDPKAFLFLSRGLPEKDYRFIGVASSSDGTLVMKPFLVRVGKPKPPPVTPPKDPPVVTPQTFFFLIVRADGPAAPAFTRIMADPAWKTLKTQGHRVRDMTVSEAGVFAEGLASLPAVVTLEENATNSKIVKTGPLPSTSEAILALPK